MAATAEAADRACVILPDAASSPRWENFDRKYLQEGLEEAGFDVDIQNAQGDVNKYSTIADQQLTQGCGVMLLVDYQGAAEAVATKAKAEGIPVIAYDRPFTRRGLLRVVRQHRGRPPGGPDRARRSRGRRQGPGHRRRRLHGRRPDRRQRGDVPRRRRRGDGGRGHHAGGRAARGSGTRPSRRPTSSRRSPGLGGKVDGVWAANDTNAAGVIKVLQDNNLTGVAVSGQDANVAGLQNILLGWQTATVYKPVKEEADAAVDTAVALLKGDDVDRRRRTRGRHALHPGDADPRRSRPGQGRHRRRRRRVRRRLHGRRDGRVRAVRGHRRVA